MTNHTAPTRIRAVEIDQSTGLRDCLALRYRVYCRDRDMMPRDSCPDGIETDEFDPVSLHIGAYDADDGLVGTVRVIRQGPWGLPLYRHCSITPEEGACLPDDGGLGEVSRLAVGRPDGEALNRRGQMSVVLSLYTAMYDACRRHGVTHLICAMEKTRLRLLARYNLCFFPIGPESHYENYGQVRPYAMELTPPDPRAPAAPAPGRRPHGILDQVLEHLEPQTYPELAPGPLRMAGCG